jgi:PII-like signaling protein
MLSAGKAVKVSIYLSEGETHHGVSTYSTILDFLFFRGVAGATVLKGVAGFGADHHLHSSSFVEIADRLPLKIEFIESQEKVTELLGKLEQMVGSGLIELQETTVAKPARSSQAEPQRVENVRIAGTAKLMRIYIAESERWGEQPLHEALITALRANDLAGATVYRGILGYGVDGRIHKDKALALSHDSLMMISVIDTDEKVQSILPLLDRMVGQGFVVLSDVDVIRYAPRAAGTAGEGVAQ